MNTIEAMDEIHTLLRQSNTYSAQLRVIEIERAGSVLPSSVFERVLRAAVRAGELTDAYRTFCERAYGRNGFVRVLEAIKLEDAPTVRRRNPFRGIAV